jgi:hypothetical protein
LLESYFAIGKSHVSQDFRNDFQPWENWIMLILQRKRLSYEPHIRGFKGIPRMNYDLIINFKKGVIYHHKLGYPGVSRVKSSWNQKSK